MTFFTFTTVIFASFPAVDTEYTEFVSNNQSESKSPGSKVTGVLLGFLLGPVGVLIAYLMDDNEMLRAAWKGFLVSMVLALVIVISIFTFLIRVASSTTLY
tara:strand:- start:2077 stop:2379 length:303 start_codon:yes stop_codon:yes gene_type:complete